MEGSMAGTDKPSIVAAFIVAWGLVGLVPTAAMAQFPIPMIPNFNFGPQHYRSGSSHYSTSHSHAHQNEDSAPDKTKEKDATQPDATASASSAQRQQQTSAPPRDATSHDAASHDVAPSSGTNTAANPPPAQKTNDDPPEFQPSR
jgi:hypothetical protein